MTWFPIPFFYRASLRRTAGLLGILIAVVVACGLIPGRGWALTLKAAHSHGEGQRELRHRVIEVLADQLAQRTGSLEIKIYPRGILFREGELWTGLTSGTLEIAALPLVRLRGLDPMFAAPSLPGLAATEDRIHAFSREAAMEKIRAALEARGVRVLADMWVPGVFIGEGSTCLGGPESLKAKRVAAGGRMAGDLAQGQGADLAPLAVGDAPQLLDGGKGISVVVAPELDLIDGGAPKGRACVTLSNGIVPWFDYEPILMSQKAWNLLTPSQAQALTEAAAFAESYGRQMMDMSLQERLQSFKGDRLTWAAFTESNYRAWRRLSLPVLAQLVGLPMSVVAPKEDGITIAHPTAPPPSSPRPSTPQAEPEPKPEPKVAAPTIAPPAIAPPAMAAPEVAAPEVVLEGNAQPTGGVIKSDSPEKPLGVRYVIKRKSDDSGAMVSGEGAAGIRVAPREIAPPASVTDPKDTTEGTERDAKTMAENATAAPVAVAGDGQAKAVGVDEGSRSTIPPLGLGP
jgi:TRAP-type C4-dicarboxylate transport system substrate-binding protein